MPTRLAAIQSWHSAHTAIPKGWRVVRENQAIKAGDRYPVYNPHLQWITVPEGASRVGMKCRSDCFVMHITPVTS